MTLGEAEWLSLQGLSAYVYHCLRERGLLSLLANEVATFLQESYYREALIEALQHQEATSSILAALNQAGVETVLMKGAALAHTVYPSPRCRPKGDLDIWIRPEQYGEAIQALKRLGYHPQDRQDRPPPLKLLYGGEQQLRSDAPGTGLIELQWPAIRGEWLRHAARIDHQGIWRRKLPIQIDAQISHVMAPEDLLIHLCIHEAINHQFGSPWLRSLLDIHLLVRAHPLHWGQLVERARVWQVATAVWTMLLLAEELCGTSIPSAMLSSLAPAPIKQRLIQRLRLGEAMLLAQSAGYSHRRFLILVAMVDQEQALLRLIRSSLFPERPWIQARYNVSDGPALWRAQFLHPLRLLRSTRA